MIAPQKRLEGRSESAKQLSARTLQLFGLLLIASSAVFWALTNRESALMVGAGITLSTLGWLQRTFLTVQDRLPQYEPPEIPEVEAAARAIDTNHRKERA